MTSKNTKTVLFTSLIAAMVLSFYGMQFAVAEETDKIPTDKLIERTAEKWASKYDTTEEFQIEFSLVKNYTQVSFPEGGFVQFIQKETIRRFNIETIIGERIDADELVALYIAKERANGTYDKPYHAVQKYHDWILSQYDTQTTEDIDGRILEIIGNSKYLKISQEFVDSKNLMAMYGLRIPTELFFSDTGYWDRVLFVGECNFVDHCDFEKIQKIFDYPTISDEQMALLRGQLRPHTYTESNCPEDTTPPQGLVFVSLPDGGCVVISLKDCAEEPYDHLCGIEEDFSLSSHEDLHFLPGILVFVISVVFIITLIIWMKKTK